MKFGKRLQRLLDDSIPQWRDKFIDYKSLKKVLKLMMLLPHEGDVLQNLHSNCPHDLRIHILQGVDFIGLLNAEIDKMNSFFLEKEEEFIIRLQVMLY
jgi:SPX domain protein involved in polyphosphate accumulation